MTGGTEQLSLAYTSTDWVRPSIIWHVLTGSGLTSHIFKLEGGRCCSDSLDSDSLKIFNWVSSYNGPWLISQEMTCRDISENYRLVQFHLIAVNHHLTPHTTPCTLHKIPQILQIRPPTPDTNTTKPGLGLWSIRKKNETVKIIQPTFIVYLKNILKFNSG